MIRVVSLIITLLIPSVALSQLELQSEYQPYEKIVAEYKWTAVGDQEIDLIWDVPSGIEYEQVGNRLFLWAKPSSSRYDLRLTTQTKTYEEVELAGGIIRRFMIQATIQLHRKQFYVRSGPDVPPPPPPPPDPDDPDLPDEIPEGHYKLIRNSYDWAMLVPQPYRSQAIQKLASNFEEASKSTASPAVMLDNLRLANRVVLPETLTIRTAWLPFFEKWSAHMADMLADGRLANLTSSHQKAFEETKQGLEAAAKESQ